MIALVDCNNFFVSCERLFRPDLKNKPVLVLSNNDGCVVARSNEVKELGIPMGVPYFKVRDVVEKNKVQCFSSNFALYSNMSQRILGVLSRYAPQIEVYSIDEAFLDITQLAEQNLEEWGGRLRREIAQDVGMPVSVGIAPTKTLAKLAASYAKTHKQTCVIDPASKPQEYKKILNKTEVGAVWGVGWRMAPKLHKASIRTAWQLSQVSEPWIHAQMGVNGTRMLSELGGLVAHPFEEDKAPQKTLMASRSFGHTVKNIHDLETAVATFASQAAYRLRKHQQVTGTFGVYLRYKNKDGEIKSATATVRMPIPTSNTSDLVRAALELTAHLYDEENGYKKAGVFANQLTSANISQVDLFNVTPEDEQERRQSFMKALDEINQRYGAETIHIGSIDPKSTRWHALKNRMSPAYVTDWKQLPLVHPLAQSK